jgi:PIN domain nuclease of toxin-antitoxin system
MRLLLDTHIWLWSHLDPDRLSKRVARHLENPKNELWLSAVSTWEVMTLAGRGRLALEPNPASWVRRALDAAPMHEAALSHAIAMASADTGLAHTDPADHLIVATAAVLGLTLITSDTRILSHANVKTLQN